MALQGTLAARGLPEGFGGGGGAGNISTRVAASRGLYSQNQPSGRNSLDSNRRRSLGGARFGPHPLLASAVVAEPVVGNIPTKVRIVCLSWVGQDG